jgi:hypothetical protein
MTGKEPRNIRFGELEFLSSCYVISRILITAKILLFRPDHGDRFRYLSLILARPVLLGGLAVCVCVLHVYADPCARF